MVSGVTLLSISPTEAASPSSPSEEWAMGRGDEKEIGGNGGIVGDEDKGVDQIAASYISTGAIMLAGFYTLFP
jgi:hypothetical protein